MDYSIEAAGNVAINNKRDLLGAYRYVVLVQLYPVLVLLLVIVKITLRRYLRVTCTNPGMPRGTLKVLAIRQYRGYRVQL